MQKFKNFSWDVLGVDTLGDSWASFDPVSSVSGVAHARGLGMSLKLDQNTCLSKILIDKKPISYRTLNQEILIEFVMKNFDQSLIMSGMCLWLSLESRRVRVCRQSCELARGAM